MDIVKVFVDTSIVNRILELDFNYKKNTIYEEDKIYILKIKKEFVDTNRVQLIVNPSVKREIKNTADIQRRGKLLALFKQFQFTEYNKTIFPFTFPATFLTDNEKPMLRELEKKIKGFKKDAKIFLDAVSNEKIEILLTTDRKHLACVKLNEYIYTEGLDKKIRIFTPKEFYEYLRSKYIV
jgi:predicted nucleic acid-binding protein